MRLRIINGATATGFSIDLGILSAISWRWTASAVLPVNGSQFPLSMGQRADIVLSLPKEGGVFPVLALREGAPERPDFFSSRLAQRFRAWLKAGRCRRSSPGLDLEARLRAVEPLAARAPEPQLPGSSDWQHAGYSWAWRGIPSGCARGESIRDRDDEHVDDGSSHASSWPPLPDHGDRGQPFARRDARHGAGAAMQTVRFAFDANNPAKDWAFHCHHLYHNGFGYDGHHWL